MRFDARHLTAVSGVLKARFPNLTVAETIKLTVQIIDAIKEAYDPDGPPDLSMEGLISRVRADSQLSIAEVQAINIERANRWHGGDFRNWSGLEWAGAMCGEAGEAANFAKKLKRDEDGIAGNAWSDRPLESAKLVAGLAKEAADTFLYLTLLCSRYGINLASATRETFNAKSVDLGYPERLP